MKRLPSGSRIEVLKVFGENLAASHGRLWEPARRVRGDVERAKSRPENNKLVSDEFAIVGADDCRCLCHERASEKRFNNDTFVCQPLPTPPAFYAKRRHNHLVSCSSSCCQHTWPNGKLLTSNRYCGCTIYGTWWSISCFSICQQHWAGWQRTVGGD